MNDSSKSIRQITDVPSQNDGLSTHGDCSLRCCAALFIISGAAALIYQVIWVRILGLSMGTTSVAVSSVVAAFFLGLALGSYAAGFITRGNLLKLYLILEVVIGLSGLLILSTLLNLDKIMAILPVWGTHLSTKFAITIAILLIPTTCMGATFPILARACMHTRSNKVGVLGQLYAFNTIGAVVGVLGAGFILIPYVGLAQATYVACSLNILAGFIALTMQKQQGSVSTYNDLPNEINEGTQLKSSVAWIGLIALFTMGMVSLGLQIAWTQYLSLFMGGTIYGFTAILSVFLIGISVGAWALHSVSERIAVDQTTYFYGLLILAGTLILTRSALTLMPDIANSVRGLQDQPHVFRAAKYAIVLAILFVPTFLMGGLFPVAMSIYSAGSKTARNALGTGYAVNTVGGIVGVLLVGLWLIPSKGTDDAIIILIFIVIVLILLFTITLPRTLDKIVAVIAASFLTLQCLTFSGLNYQSMIIANPYRFDSSALSGRIPEFLYLKEGKSSVISAITYDRSIAELQSNGIRESTISIHNNVPPPKAETLLGVLPYLLHRNPKSAFVIGFGGGHTTNALVATPLDSIKVVELESAVVEAVETVAMHATASLRDERVELVINDARNTLLVNQVTYDLIVSQPSHPWLAGAGGLFTKEFFDIVKSRLNTDGIFAQWINLFNMDTTTLLSILKAYYTVFPYGFAVALTDSGDLLILGSSSPIVFDLDDIDQKIEAAGISSLLGHWNMTQAESVVGSFTLSRDQILQASSNIRTNTDNRIFSEVRLANLMKDPTDENSPYNWITKTADRDMEDYFHPENVADSLFKLGLYFKENRQFNEVDLIYAQLTQLDSTVAQKLKNPAN